MTLPTDPMDHTTLNSKGQVTIPKSVRDELQRMPGTVFLVVLREGGVLLTPEPLFTATRPPQVEGCLKSAVQPGRFGRQDNQAIGLALRQRATDEDRATHSGESPP